MYEVYKFKLVYNHKIKYKKIFFKLNIIYKY